MKRTRLGKTRTGFWKSRIKKVKPMWEVKYEVYERKGNSLKSTGEFAQVMVGADDEKGAKIETRRMLAPIYNTYHYSYKVVKVKKL